jgi:hypothetical protein
MGLIDSIIGAESGGNPNASNPSSSASGLGQFIDSTWLSTLRAHRPDLADQPDSALLALKSDPQLSREMTGAYAADNQAILAKAGVPVTDGNTYLAHFAGPGGAVKVLQADPNAPVGGILGAGVVSANPFLRGMTAGDLQAWAARKVGGSASAPQTASASPASSPVAPAAARVASALMGTPPQQAQPQAAPAADFSAFAGISPQAPPQAAEPQMAMAPIFIPPRKQIDLSGLRAALAQAFHKDTA